MVTFSTPLNISQSGFWIRCRNHDLDAKNVVQAGTGRAAQLDRAVAGKTGTSDESRDLWFIGYIPQW